MKELTTPKQFRKDLKRLRKQGKDLSKLTEVVDMLRADIELDEMYKAHQLVGNWAGFWDLHIEPDWLLIYQTNEVEVYLARSGSHSEIFG